MYIENHIQLLIALIERATCIYTLYMCKCTVHVHVNALYSTTYIHVYTSTCTFNPKTPTSTGAERATCFRYRSMGDLCLWLILDLTQPSLLKPSHSGTAVQMALSWLTEEPYTMNMSWGKERERVMHRQAGRKMHWETRTLVEMFNSNLFTVHIQSHNKLRTTTP